MGSDSPLWVVTVCTEKALGKTLGLAEVLFSKGFGAS